MSLIFIKLTDEEEIRFSETDDENDVDYLSPADTGSSSDSLEFDSETEKMERNTKVKINWNESHLSNENGNKMAKCSNSWDENAM